jgi:thiol:disulfide interchange protein DsbC
MDPTRTAIASSTETTMVDVPLELALKEVRGEGKRRMIVFEDPYCPYCRRLDTSLQQVDNVTVYVFLYPVLTADSVVKAKSIWCSPDRAVAWREWMLDGKAPAAAGTCATPIARSWSSVSAFELAGLPRSFSPMAGECPVRFLQTRSSAI